MALFANDAPTWIAIVTAYVAVMLTPGPNFLLVLDAACSGSQRVALSSALGVASGAATLALAAFLAGSALTPSEPLISFSRLAFGALVTALGFRTLTSAARPVTEQPVKAKRETAHFRIALATSIGNPITALFFLAAAATAAGTVTTLERVALGAAVFAMAAVWFAAVAVIGGAGMRALRRGTPSGVRIAQACRLAAGVALMSFGLHRFIAEAAALPF
ncbi:LysE family transporter [Methylopila turkensis]|uniref:Lysine transporter LysE n=1 Tax=Methylopila turkensis TaxID=1437816 RepID=A0A9W6N6P2_9HYPH|nr:LysE family transporter [Methylopila turkensis]GLK80469.1 hypothetical protein GCM10008174_22100 [Methylopila turkensis]